MELSRAARLAPRLWRLLEIGCAAALLLAAAPLLLLGALAVWLESGRPIFFGHPRLGRDGVPFRCWKLRTMEVGAEERLEREPALRQLHRENGFKLPIDRDPRITPVGRRLRRSYVDELPQLYNVLNGTMALVGPRPIVPEELACFGSEAAELLRVRPGVFGAWTCLGRQRPGYPVRAEVELAYVRGRSARTDARILLHSIPVVLRGQDER